MKRTLWLLPIILLFCFKATSQINFGQSAQEVLYLLEYVRKGKKWEIEKQYFNGEIQEIRVYKHDQLYYDLQITTDAIDRYVIKGGKYHHLESQLLEVSFEFVKERFDRFYGDTKVGDYYFYDDYTTYQTILLKDGVPTTIYGKTELDKLPKGIKNAISKHKILVNEREREKERIAERKQQIQDSLSTIVVDLKGYDKIPFERTAIQSIFNEYGEKSNEAPTKLYGTFEIELEELPNQSYATVGVVPIDESNFLPFELGSNIKMELPKAHKDIEGNLYVVGRRAVFELQYDITYGTAIINLKRSGIKTLTNVNLTKELISAVDEYLKIRPYGKYEIKYQYGNINNQSALRFSVKKL